MTRRLRSIAFISTAFLPALAFAHPGHAEHAGFAQGLLHPFGGTDHMLALAAVGMLAGRLGGRAMVALLGAWMCLMVVGAAGGLAGMQLPPVRPVLIVSIGACALLALVTTSAAPRSLVGIILSLAALFAFFQGYAHAERALATSGGAAFITGIAAASAAVLALAAAVTHWISRLANPATAGERR